MEHSAQHRAFERAATPGRDITIYAGNWVASGQIAKYTPEYVTLLGANPRDEAMLTTICTEIIVAWSVTNEETENKDV